MSNKSINDLLQEDIYEIFEIAVDANEKKIKKSFRKKALECHPDKNPDNPNAAEQFNKLKKILEILLDPGARSAYDKVLKSKKAAALRSREADSRSQQLKADLEERERAINLNQDSKSRLSEEERLRREIKRLEEEGQQLIAEELEKLNQEAETLSKNGRGNSSPSDVRCENRIKAKWKKTDHWEGYTKQEIENLFYKWGEINAVVMKTKGSRTTALIEFKDASGANLAAQFEKGAIGKPLEVTHCSKPGEKDEKGAKNKGSADVKTASRDFESVAEMNRRREAERQKIIQQLMNNDHL